MNFQSLSVELHRVTKLTGPVRTNKVFLSPEETRQRAQLFVGPLRLLPRQRAQLFVGMV